jgi:hypothetical protein
VLPLLGGVVDLDDEEPAPYAVTGTVDKVVADLEPQAIEESTERHATTSQPALAHGAAG